MQWNYKVGRAIVSQVPEDEIRQIKQKWITERIRLSIDVFGKCPEKLARLDYPVSPDNTNLQRCRISIQRFILHSVP